MTIFRNNRSIRRYAIAAIVLLCGSLAVPALSDVLARGRVSLPADHADSELEVEGKRLKGFTLGFEGLLADWYWINSLQYIGSKILDRDVNIDDLREFEPRLLYPYLDNATDLDPKFLAPYAYGAIVLPAIDPEMAKNLSEKAIANNPDEWILYHYLGYIHWRLKEFDAAAEVYARGARVQGAPDFMKLMEPLMRGQGGSRATAREMYGQLLSLPENDPIRKTAEIRLLQLNALDELDTINAALKKLNAASGSCPPQSVLINELSKMELSHGELRANAEGKIADPSGLPYKFDAETCSASIAPDSPIPTGE